MLTNWRKPEREACHRPGKQMSRKEILGGFLAQRQAKPCHGVVFNDNALDGLCKIHKKV